jgi:hypothetical protein
LLFEAALRIDEGLMSDYENVALTKLLSCRVAVGMVHYRNRSPSKLVDSISEIIRARFQPCDYENAHGLQGVLGVAIEVRLHG